MAMLPIEPPVTPLRQRMLDDIAMRAMGSRTRHQYVRHVRAFAAFLGEAMDLRSGGLPVFHPNRVKGFRLCDDARARSRR